MELSNGKLVNLLDDAEVIYISIHFFALTDIMKLAFDFLRAFGFD